MDVKWVIWIFIGSLLCLLFCNTYYIKIYKPFPYSWTNIRNIFKQPSKEFPNKVCLICFLLSHWLDFWVIILKIFKHPSTGLSTNIFTWNLWNHSMSAWYMYMHFLFSYKLDTFSTKSRVRKLVKIFLSLPHPLLLENAAKLGMVIRTHKQRPCGTADVSQRWPFPAHRP